MALDRPDLFLQSRWALAFSGDRIATAVLRGQRHGPHYELVATIIVKGAPVVEIYHRDRSGLRPPPVCEEYIGQACAPEGRRQKMKIPFTKAHGARNDFLLTWRDHVPRRDRCSRRGHRDLRSPHRRRRGWLALGFARAAPPIWRSSCGTPTAASPRFQATARAARRRVSSRVARGSRGSHPDRRGPEAAPRCCSAAAARFSFEMNMGEATIEELHRDGARSRCRPSSTSAIRSARCSCDHFDFDWRTLGADHRTPSAVSEPHQRVLCPASGRTYARCPVFRARRGRDHEFGHRVHRRGRGGAGPRACTKPCPGTDAGRSARFTVGKPRHSARRAGGDSGGGRILLGCLIVTGEILTHSAAVAPEDRKSYGQTGVVGLGYVGLPLAVELAHAGFSVTGIDIDQSKVDSLNRANPIFRTFRPRC